MTMRALVKTANGFRYYGGSLGDDHVFSAKTDYTDESSVNTVLDAELAEYTDDANTVALTAEIYPRNGDEAPYDKLNIGDSSGWPDIDAVRDRFRTVQFRVSETDRNNVRFGIGANSRIEDDAARLAHLVDLATPGALSGRSDSVPSANLGAGISFGKLSTAETGTYEQAGELVAEEDPTSTSDDGHSSLWPVDNPITIYRVRWSLKQAGDTDTIVHVRKNLTGPFSRTTAGVTSHFFHEIVIPAGATAPDDDSNLGMYTNYTATKGDVISVAVHQAGSFARGLIVRVKHTSQT